MNRRGNGILGGVVGAIADVAAVLEPAKAHRVSCAQCGLVGDASITKGPCPGIDPRTGQQGLATNLVAPWVESPAGWSFSFVQGQPGAPPTAAFRCRRCTRRLPNVGREQFDDAADYGAVIEDGRLLRAGTPATTCLECGQLVSRGAYASARELDAHRHECKGPGGLGSVEPT